MNLPLTTWLLVLASAALQAFGAIVLLRGSWKGRRASLGIFGAATVALAASGALVYGLFLFLDLNLDQNAGLLWPWVCLSGVLVGFVAAARAGRMPIAELATAAAIVLELAGLLVVLTGEKGGLAAPPVRALLVAPAALALCLYFGASLGVLLFADGRRDAHLGYEATVAKRFLISKSSSALSTVTLISIAGVALGVWLVLVSLGVLSGFEGDLERKIIGANAHVVLQSKDGSAFELPPTALDRFDKISGVVAASPIIEGEVAIASSSNYTGALIFGIDPVRSPRVLTVLETLEDGSLQPLVDESRPVPEPPEEEESEFPPPAPMPSIVVGVEMAKTLSVRVGDKVRVISPLLEVLTPVGVSPRTLGFRVEAIFASKMYEYDARFAFVSLAAARRFLQLDSGHVTGIQLRTENPDHSSRVGERALGLLEQGSFEALDWKGRNQTLFSALKLERVVALVVLAFIILVASFSIVNTLSMSIIEKRKEIAILKTMGARDVGIMKLFLTQGLLVGGSGTIVGLAAAIATVEALQRFGFSIPGEVYYIDSLPVRLEVVDVALVLVAALLIVWDFSVFPAFRGSQLQPVEGLRDG